MVLDVDRSNSDWIGKVQTRQKDERLKQEGRGLMALEDVEMEAQEEGDNEPPAKRADIYLGWRELPRENS